MTRRGPAAIRGRSGPLTTIRPATTEDLPACQDVERAAGRMFIDVGMPDIAAHAPMSLDAMRGYQSDGRAWIADVDGRVVGYVLAEVVDGNGHIEEVSVDPAFGRKGIGRALIERAVEWAAACGHPAVTLTTFRDVPWNAPFYRRCRFVDMAEDELGPEMRAKRTTEAGYGLDPDLRVCMRRSI